MNKSSNTCLMINKFREQMGLGVLITSRHFQSLIWSHLLKRELTAIGTEKKNKREFYRTLQLAKPNPNLRLWFVSCSFSTCRVSTRRHCDGRGLSCLPQRESRKAGEAPSHTVILRVAVSFLVLFKILDQMTDRWPDLLSRDGSAWTATPAVTGVHCGKHLLGCHMPVI